MSESKKKLDPVAELIVEMVAALKPGKSMMPNQVAEEFAIRQWDPVTPPPGEWRKYLDTTKQQAIYLARQKEIILIRKGKPMDLSQPIKGVIRLGQAPPPVK